MPTTTPLSLAQQGLWLVEQLHPGSAAYNVPVAVELDGALDVPALHRALQRVVDRHEALRTIVREVAGAPFQHVEPHLELSLSVTDLTGISADARDAAVRELVDAWAAEPFDLALGPLVRARLIRLGGTGHVLVLVLHHLICDGPSLHLLFDELADLYAGVQPRPLPMQYAQFAAMERGRVLSTSEIDWWRGYLADAPTALAVPTDRPYPTVRRTDGATSVLRLPAATAAGITSLARRLRATPFTVALAAYAALVGRLGGVTDVLIGTPVGGRTTAELEPLIGFFVTTVPVRVNLSGDPSFTDLVRRVRSSTLEAISHRDVPFEALVDALRIDRDPGRTPLVQTVFTYESTPMVQPRFAGLTARPLTLRAAAAKFDLDVMAVNAPDGSGDVEVSITYSTALFDEPTADRIGGALVRMLAAAVADPELPVGELPLIGVQERATILHEWARTGSAHDPGATVDELFARRAAATPSEPAVVSGDGTLTYRGLADRAAGLADHLTSLGVRPDDVVGVLLPRIPDLATALLGVLRAGAAYLPLDPTHPADHLARVLTAAGARVVVATAPTAHRLDGAPVTVVDIDRLDLDNTTGTRDPAVQRGVRRHPDQLAYVIFTSGSTGEPKGVGIPHRALVNHALAIRDRFGLRPSDRVLQFANIGFDVAAEELFPTWLAGASVVLAPEPTPPPTALTELLIRDRITVANLPASYWQLWTGELDRDRECPAGLLRLLVVGSESVDAATLNTWCRDTGVPVINAYGLTETTVTAVIHAVEPPILGPGVPIGRPIDGVRAYVLDRELRPVPPGTPGELYLAGAALARGYLGRPDLTAQRFVPDPFGRPGGRMHRTGDRARWRTDGTIEVLGRADTQLKVGGYRVEPAQVEAAMSGHPDVAQSVVAIRPGAHGNRLIGYVVPRTGTAQTPVVPADLRTHLSARLPAYLIPAAFVALEAMPVTAGGKLDRASLPDPTTFAPARPGERNGEAVTDLERAVAAIWRDVLRLDRVGVHDNFFDLGGSSIALAGVHARLTDLLGRRLPVVTLYEHPTIAALAGHLSEPVAPPSIDEPDDGRSLRAGRARLARQRRTPAH